MSDAKDLESSTLYLGFTILDVFTRQRYRGNPLAVVYVPDAFDSRITTEIKQRIAREFNLSETAFIHLPDPNAVSTTNNATIDSCRVDIFTVDEELPFAGHPVIGAAYIVLNQVRCNCDALRLKAGSFPIRQVRETDYDSSLGSATSPASLVRVNVVHNLHVHSRTLADVLAGPVMAVTTTIAASLSSDEIIRQAELCAPVVSIVQGMTAILVKLPTLAHLSQVSTASRLRFDKDTQELLLDKGHWESSFCYRYYYVDVDREEDGQAAASSFKKEHAPARHFRARMVELATEDPATGSAACTLGAYLAINGPYQPGPIRFEIAQGVEMGRKSDIVVEVKAELVDGAVTLSELALCGAAVTTMVGKIQV